MFNLNIYLHLDFLDFILRSCAVQWHKSCFGSLTSKISNHLQSCIQGFNARKVISEVYASFVLQCTVFGRKSKHKTDVTAWHGIHFHKNNLWNILVIRNYYVNFQNYQNSMCLTSSDTKRTLMPLSLFTKFAQREQVSICTRSIHDRN